MHFSTTTGMHTTVFLRVVTQSIVATVALGITSSCVSCDTPTTYCDTGNRVIISNFIGRDNCQPGEYPNQTSLTLLSCGWLEESIVRAMAVNATRITLTTTQDGSVRSVWTDHPDALTALRSEGNWQTQTIADSWKAESASTADSDSDWCWDNACPVNYNPALLGINKWPNMYTSCSQECTNWMAAHYKVHSHVDSRRGNDAEGNILMGLTASSTWLTMKEGDCVQGWPGSGGGGSTDDDGSVGSDVGGAEDGTAEPVNEQQGDGGEAEHEVEKEEDKEEDVVEITPTPATAQGAPPVAFLVGLGAVCCFGIVAMAFFAKYRAQQANKRDKQQEEKTQTKRNAVARQNQQRQQRRRLDDDDDGIASPFLSAVVEETPVQPTFLSDQKEAGEKEGESEPSVETGSGSAANTDSRKQQTATLTTPTTANNTDGNRELMMATTVSPVDEQEQGRSLSPDGLGSSPELLLTTTLTSPTTQPQLQLQLQLQPQPQQPQPQQHSSCITLARPQSQSQSQSDLKTETTISVGHPFTPSSPSSVIRCQENGAAAVAAAAVLALQPPTATAVDSSALPVTASQAGAAKKPRPKPLFAPISVFSNDVHVHHDAENHTATDGGNTSDTASNNSLSGSLPSVLRQMNADLCRRRRKSTRLYNNTSTAAAAAVTPPPHLELVSPNNSFAANNGNNKAYHHHHVDSHQGYNVSPENNKLLSMSLSRRSAD